MEGDGGGGGGDGDLKKPLSPCGSCVTKSKLRASFDGRKNTVRSLLTPNTHRLHFHAASMKSTLVAGFNNLTVCLVRKTLVML